MFSTILVSALIASQIAGTPAPAPEKNPEAEGIVAGTLSVPPEVKFPHPVTVLLLGPRHLDQWNSDVQKRLDVYWERYKPAFAQRKEFFMDISRQAYRDSILFLASRMRRENPEIAATYLREVPADGRFEFKNVPFGNYKIVAYGRAVDQDVVLQESLEITSPVPQFIQVKKRVP